MSNSGSVAPKERINIVYKAAAGDVLEEKELPLKAMVMGDFTLKEDERTVEERKPISIDKANFNEVMEGQDLSLDINVPDRLSGEEEEDAELSLSLKFKSMADFKPDSVVEQVEELSKIIELRTALMALKGPMGNVPAVRKTIQKLLDNDDSRSKLASELGVQSA